MYQNEEFHRRSKGGDLRKSKVLGLGGVLEASYISTTLQEVGFFPALVYFYLWAVWIVVADFMADLRGRLAGFTG